MSGKPEISVCIPVYNVAPYLQQCIDSLMDQTIDVETEYIFVNDCSTDDSGEILRRNQKLYPNKMRVLEHSENLRQGAARNTAMEAAQGRYIGFVDSDDFVSPRIFETLYLNALETDADVTYIQYASVSADEIYERKKLENGGGYSPIFPWNPNLLRWHNQELTDEGRMDLICYPIGGLCCGLWKKSVFETSGVKFPTKLRYEDNYFGSLTDCYLTKASFVPEVLYFYRQNPLSTTHAQNAAHQLDRIEIERSLLREVKRRGFFERCYPAWEYLYAFRYAFNTCMMLLRTYPEPPVNVFQEVCNDLRRNFPDWRKNHYYRSITSPTNKLRNELLYRFPRLVATVFPFAKKLKECH